MGELWRELSTLNQVFAVAAAFFSVLFLWQMIGAITGLAGGEADLDTAGADADVDAGDADVADTDADVSHDGLEGDHGGAGTMVAFKLLSLRSIIAFGTLFSWAGTLYLPKEGMNVTGALIRAVIWGLAAMIIVSFLIYKLVGMQETGTASLKSALGQEGTVYANIPENGEGKVRVMVGGRVSFVRARSKDGSALTAGTKITVLRLRDASTLEVEKTDS